ncbi:hypothetical protein [Thomasclavelia cocleata]|uniref:hypothetical protein n=1 Tax=Thomasclavelia cocleata TaxID=69824 RepID=UPI00255ADBDD|nr:hypothetical protein [Thomasclavelia cocleata]
MMNKKMQRIYKKAITSKITLELSEYTQLFFPCIKKIYDCVILSCDNQKDLETKFESKIKFLGSKEYYEVSENEILVNMYLKETDSVLEGVQLSIIAIELWKEQLKILCKGDKFCYIMSCDEMKNIILRFHKIRNDSDLWVDRNVQNYKEAIAYFIY